MAEILSIAGHKEMLHDHENASVVFQQAMSEHLKAHRLWMNAKTSKLKKEAKRHAMVNLDVMRFTYSVMDKDRLSKQEKMAIKAHNLMMIKHNQKGGYDNVG